eukprot:2351349-Pyramimonas_sp.AAC.1
MFGTGEVPRRCNRMDVPQDRQPPDRSGGHPPGQRGGPGNAAPGMLGSGRPRDTDACWRGSACAPFGTPDPGRMSAAVPPARSG